MSSAQEFFETIKNPEPPAKLSPALRALWWARKSDWDKAHHYVQQHEGDPSCDLVHAYLHRQEGDTENARNWYRGAGRSLPTVSLRDEWDSVAAELLSAR
jgi:hypothetical protein